MRTLLLLTLLSCAGKQLTPAGNSVTTRFPSFKKCSKIASLQSGGSTLKEVYIDARNRAGELGGNYVDIDVPRSTMTSFSTTATAYHCR